MKYLRLIMIFTALSFSCFAQNGLDTLDRGKGIFFVENQGQWEQPYLYEAQLQDAALFAEIDAITIALRNHTQHPEINKQSTRYHAYRLNFVGANSTSPYGQGRQNTYNNYFLGSSPATWKSNVPLYSVLKYDNLYEGIDLEIYGAQKAIKYNFIVHPEGNANNICMEYEGTDGVKLSANQGIRIATSVRNITEMPPYVYQEGRDGENIAISASWKITKTKAGNYQVKIVVGDYDHTRDLVIDPTLIFSTYTGSTADNWGTTATYDAHKNVYTAGLVFSIGYPTSLGAYQTGYGGGHADIGLFKFDSLGTNRLYATYLGGQSVDMPHSMITNSFDEIIVMGTTGSYNFPTTASAYQPSFGGGQHINYLSASLSYESGSDLFISRLSSDGTSLLASTYIGGSGNDGLNFRPNYYTSMQTVMNGNDTLYKNYGDGARGEIITDQLNNIYVGSTTFSTDFPVSTNAIQPNLAGKQEGVVFKLDHNLHTLLWSTYIGGSKDDAVYSIDVDKDYNLIVCGGTSSSDFPITNNVYQPTYGGGSTDGFVSKISYDGESLMASSYIGEVYYDQLYFVRTGSHDDVFLFGQTYPTGGNMIHNAAYSVYNSGMLLARLSPLLDTLRWSTVFGSSGRINLSPTAFGVDICDRVYAVGWGRDFVGYNGVGWNQYGTTGMDITNDAFQNTTDGQDFYIISLSSDASNLEYATFFGELHGSPNSMRGSDHVDGGTSRFDKQSTLYQSVCASCAGDNGFPITANVWSQDNKSPNCNNAIFRFNIHNDYPVAEFTLPPSGCAPYTLQFNNTGRGESYWWDFGDGQQSTATSPTHTYTTPGTYTVTLVAQMENGCKNSDTVQHTVQVLGSVALSHSPEIACNGTPMQIGVTPALGATYYWTGDSVSDPTVANPWVSQTGTYILHTTVGGCSQTDTFYVQGYSLIDLLQPTNISCHNYADGQLRLRIGTDINPDSISITVDPPLPISIEYADSHNWFLLDSIPPDIEYTITAIGYGCQYTTTVRLPNPPNPPFLKESNQILCSDSCIGSIYIRYNFDANTETDTTIANLCEGTYIVDFISMGCPVSDTTIITRDSSLAHMRATADNERIFLGESVGLHAYGIIGDAFYQWTPTATLDNPNSSDPIATPTDTSVCYYVSATTPSGCTASDSVCIQCTEVLCGEPDFIIPNAFTPNGDGINDRICFDSEVLSEFHIAIFNRWGQVVFESSTIGSCWDGTFRNEMCLAGVYTYSCHIKCHGGYENDIKGDITLIR